MQALRQLLSAQLTSPYVIKVSLAYSKTGFDTFEACIHLQYMYCMGQTNANIRMFE